MSALSAGFGFGTQLRLRTSREFQEAKAAGKRIPARHLILYVAKGATSESRVGIIASRKVGNAVRRNRCKRLVREVFRLNRATFPAPLDVVVIVKSQQDAVSYGMYERDFLHAVSLGFQAVGRPAPASTKGHDPAH